jgi:hypothetical protein
MQDVELGWLYEEYPAAPAYSGGHIFGLQLQLGVSSELCLRCIRMISLMSQEIPWWKCLGPWPSSTFQVSGAGIQCYLML